MESKLPSSQPPSNQQGDLISEPMSSTASCSSSASARIYPFTAPLSIMGFFTDDNMVDIISVDDNKVLINTCSGFGNYEEYKGSITCDNRPILLVLLNAYTKHVKGTDESCSSIISTTKENVLLILTSNFQFTLHKCKNSAIETVYTGSIDIEAGEALPNMHYAVDPDNSMFLLYVKKNCMTLIKWKQQHTSHDHLIIDVKNIRNISFVNRNDMSWCITTMSPGKDKQKSLITYYSSIDEEYSFYEEDKKLVPEYQFEISSEFAMLIYIPSPFGGLVILGRRMVYYVCSEKVVSFEHSASDITFQSYGVLSSTKFLFLPTHGPLVMLSFLVDVKDQNRVCDLRAQYIKNDGSIKSFFAINEQQLLVETKTGDLKYAEIRRDKTDGVFFLEILESRPNPDIRKLASPPLVSFSDQSTNPEEFKFLKNIEFLTDRPQPGDVLLTRYQVKKMISCGEFGCVFGVYDRKCSSPLVLKTTIVHPYSMKGEGRLLNIHENRPFQEEISFMKLLKKESMTTGFPKLMCYFRRRYWDVLIMTHEGTSLNRLLKLNEGHKFSTKNVLRIGRQVLQILQQVHRLGYCYRDLHSGNVLAKVSNNKTIQISFIDFGFVTKFNCQRPFSICKQASYRVCLGHTFEFVDDIFSTTVLLERCMGVHRFDAKDDDEMIQMKKAIHENPCRDLQPEQKWFGKLYRKIDECSTKSEEYILEECYKVLNTALPSFNASSVIDFTMNLDRELKFD